MGLDEYENPHFMGGAFLLSPYAPHEATGVPGEMLPRDSGPINCCCGWRIALQNPVPTRLDAFPVVVLEVWPETSIPPRPAFS